MLRKYSDGGTPLVLKYYSLGGHVMGHPRSRSNGMDVVPVYAELPLQKSGRCRVGVRSKPDFSSLLTTEAPLIQTKCGGLDDAATNASDYEEKHSFDTPHESAGISCSFLSTDSCSDPTKRTKILTVNAFSRDSCSEGSILLEDGSETTRLEQNAEALETAKSDPSTDTRVTNRPREHEAVHTNDADNSNPEDEDENENEDEDENMPVLLDSILLPRGKYEPSQATSESQATSSNWWEDDEDDEDNEDNAWPDYKTSMDGSERKLYKKRMYEEDSTRTEEYREVELLKIPEKGPSYWCEEDSPRLSLDDEGPARRRRRVDDKEYLSDNDEVFADFSSYQSEVEFESSSGNVEEYVDKSDDNIDLEYHSGAFDAVSDSVTDRLKRRKPVLLETLEDAHHTVLAGPQSRVNVELVEVHRPEGALLNEEDQYDDLVLRNVSLDSDLTNVSEEIVRVDERTFVLRSSGGKALSSEKENFKPSSPMTEQNRTAVLNDQTIVGRREGDENVFDFIKKDSAILVKSSIIRVGQPEPSPEEIVKESSLEVIERKQYIRCKEKEDETSEEHLDGLGIELNFSDEDQLTPSKTEQYPASPHYEDGIVPRNVWVRIDEDGSPLCPSCEDILSPVDEGLAGFEFPSDREQLSSYVRTREKSGQSVTSRMSSADATGDVSIIHQTKERGVQTEGTIDLVEFEEASSGCEELSDVEYEFGTNKDDNVESFDTPWGKEHHENHRHEHNHQHFFRHTHSHFVTEIECEAVTEDLVNQALDAKKNEKQPEIFTTSFPGPSERHPSEEDSDESQLLDTASLLAPEKSSFNQQLLSFSLDVEESLPYRNLENENPGVCPIFEVRDKDSIEKTDELVGESRMNSMDEDEFAILRKGHLFPDFKEDRDAEPGNFVHKKFESFSDDRLRILHINKSAPVQKSLRNVSAPCTLSVIAYEPVSRTRSLMLSADLWQGPYAWEKQTALHRAIISLSLCAHGAKVPQDLPVQNEVTQAFLSSKNDIQRSSVANRLLQSVVLPPTLGEEGVESFWWRVGTSGIFSSGAVVAVNLSSGKLSCTFPETGGAKTVAAACRCVGKALDRIQNPVPVFFVEDKFYKSLFKEQPADDVLLTPQEVVAAVKAWAVEFGVLISSTSLVVREANCVRRGQQICCLYSIGTEPFNNKHQIPAVRIQAHHSDALNSKTKPWPVAVGHIRPKSLYKSAIERAFSQGFWFLKRLHSLHSDNSAPAPHPHAHRLRRASTFSSSDQRSFPARSPSIPGPSFLNSRSFNSNLLRHNRTSTLESGSTNRSHGSSSLSTPRSSFRPMLNTYPDLSEGRQTG